MSQQISAKLNLLSLLLRINDVSSMDNVIKALFETAQKDWDNGFDAQTGDHLIKGVFQSTTKTDFVQSLVAKLVAQYIRCIGVQGNAWTKNTIASENFTNVAITNRIAATEYQDIRPLFLIIATRLLGLDDKLVEYALADTLEAKAVALVQYIASQFDLSDSYEKITTDYADAVKTVKDVLEQKLFGPQLYLDGVRYLTREFLDVEDDVTFADPLDAVIHFFDKELSKAAQAV